MMNYKKWLLTSAVMTGAAASLLTGCMESNPDGEQWKAAVETAYAKNGEIAKHAFAGEMLVDLDQTLPSGAAENPLVSGLTGMLKADEGFEWQGAVESEPLRLEADLTLRGDNGGGNGAGTQTANQVPLLIQDNKLYISIPMLNQENEYYLIDRPLDLEAASPFDPSVIRKWQDALDSLVPSVIAAADPQWVLRVSEEEEGQPMRIEIPVTKQNADQIGEAFEAGWGAAAQKLADAKLVSLETAEQWASAMEAEALKPVPGGRIAVTIDTEGFLSVQELELAFDNDDRIQLTLNKTQINAQLKMTKPIPEKVVLFSDVLTFIEAGRAANQP